MVNLIFIEIECSCITHNGLEILVRTLSWRWLYDSEQECKLIVFLLFAKQAFTMAGCVV